MSERPPPARRRSTQGRYRPPTWRSLVMFVATAAALGVYLFVNAPPPLAAHPAPSGTVPIRAVFALLERENDTARALWTQEIVARGATVGLAFDERWRDAGVHAGPLPALFLRETARSLERTGARLSLFLGSQFPISAANQFSGEQARHFAALAGSGAPQYFVDRETGLHTAMFADVAITEACVSCHNEHTASPRSDWQQGDIMGATTWMYPEPAVTIERAIELVRLLRASIRRAYASYLAKAAAFASPPPIGARWPRDGHALPSEEEFMRELARRSSPATLLALLDLASGSTAEPAPEPVVITAELAPPPAPTEAQRTMLVIRSARSTRVTVDHASGRLLDARLSPGATATVSAPPPLRIQLGDPDGVELTYGGTPLAVPGGRRKSVEVVVPAPDHEES